MKEHGEDKREIHMTTDQVRIGRNPAAEVILRDPAVSRAHARIRKEKDLYYVEDLGSHNGTLLNEKQLPAGGSCLLTHGDQIKVGRTVLRFLMDLSRKITTTWREHTGAPSSAAVAPEEVVSPGKAPFCLFRLKKLHSSLIAVTAGKTPVRFILSSDRVRIGSDPGSDIVLDHPTVSPHHAEIIYNREGFHLVDRDSESGTFLDGVATTLSRLVKGSFVRFGKIESLFSLREEGEEPPIVSFALRDHLLELYPDRREAIQKTFRESREEGLDMAEELVLGSVLSPGEWWAAVSEFRRSPASGEAGWGAWLFRGFLGKRIRPRRGDSGGPKK